MYLNQRLKKEYKNLLIHLPEKHQDTHNLMFLTIVFENSYYRYRQDALNAFLKFLYKKLDRHCCPKPKSKSQRRKRPILVAAFEETYRETYADQETNPHIHAAFLIHNDTAARFARRILDGQVDADIRDPYPSYLSNPQGHEQQAEFERQRAGLPTVHSFVFEHAVTAPAVETYILKRLRTQEDFDDKLFLFVPLRTGKSTALYEGAQPVPTTTTTEEATTILTDAVARRREEAMSNKLNWKKHKHEGKPTEPAREPKPKRKGAWTHIRRNTCRTYTDEEKAAFARERGLAVSEPRDPNLTTCPVHARRRATIRLGFDAPVLESVLQDEIGNDANCRCGSQKFKSSSPHFSTSLILMKKA